MKLLENMVSLRHWKIATMSTELCIRMLKWYQKMAAFPDDHVLVTAAMFGTTRGERPAGIPAGVLGNKVMVGEGATPWAAQFVRDLQRLSLLDDGKALLDSIGDEYLRAFTDSLVTDDFCDLDVAQLRACELSVAIAPPCLAPLPLVDAEPEDSGLFACAMCNCSFFSRQFLLLHIRRKRRIFKCAYQCTVTNACCMCGLKLKGSTLYTYSGFLHSCSPQLWWLFF